MYKVTFEFQAGQETVFVQAKAYDVNEYDADGLKLKFLDSDDNELDNFVPDRSTFEEIREQAVEYLNDHKHNQGLIFE